MWGDFRCWMKLSLPFSVWLNMLLLYLLVTKAFANFILFVFFSRVLIVRHGLVISSFKHWTLMGNLFWLSLRSIDFIWLKLQMAQTPLHVSAGYDRVDIVKFLLDWQGPEKIEMEAKNMVGKRFSNSPLFFFQCWYFPLKIGFLVLSCICWLLQYGETPLHMAAKNGCNEAARLLLVHGAFIEAKANVIFLVSLFLVLSLYVIRIGWKGLLLPCYLCRMGWHRYTLLFGTQFDPMTMQLLRHYSSTMPIAVLRTM